jgi:hypothetical protein
VSAYLTRAELSLLAADGARLVVEAGDYVEAVDVFSVDMNARRRAEWLAVMRLGLERDPPRRRRPDELDAHPVLILDVRGRMVYAHADDLLTVDDDFDP